MLFKGTGMSAFYGDDIIEEVRMANDIVDVVSDYVKLEKKGKYYFGLCPFHKEKTPSFSVTPSMQIFNCFGCSKGGNVIHFIMGVENLDFVDAVKLLADRARITLPENSEREDKNAAIRNEVRRANKEAARFFHGTLDSDEGFHARLYLQKRNLSAATITKFGLGFSSASGDKLTEHLKSKGFPEDVLLKSGLVIKGRNGIFERFKGRIMFPIFDVRGNVIGFGGRAMDDSNPKYMNSPETVVYSKGNTLYGLNYAKNSGEKKVVIVEGYLDAITLHQSGITNSVASLGTALTESQGRLLKKYFDEMIISFDTDTAGKNAALRGLDLLDEIGCNVKVLSIPDKKDPDDFINAHGPDEFRKLMEGSLSLVEYKIKVYKTENETDTTEGKIKFINKMAAVLSQLDNNINTEMYAKKLAQDYKISEESILAEIMKLRKPNKQLRQRLQPVEGKKSGIAVRSSEEQRNYHDELLMLAAISVDNQVYDLIKKNITIDEFSNEETRYLAEVIFERIANNITVTPAEALNLLKPDSVSEFSKILDKECVFDSNRKPLDIVKKIKINRLNKRKEEIFGRIQDKNNSDAQEIQNLTLELNQIIKTLAEI